MATHHLLLACPVVVAAVAVVVAVAVAVAVAMAELETEEGPQLAVVEPAGRPEMAAARATSLPLSSCQDHCPNLNAQAASNQLLLTSAAA